MNNVFDEYPIRYDKWYEKNNFAYLSELILLRKVMPETGYGLEIGVGTGRFAEPLGINKGIDISRRMLEFAKKRGVDAQIASGEAIPFKDESFDYVAIIITLCFVDNPLKVLLETARVLRKGGKIFLGIIDKESFLGHSCQRRENVFYENARLFSVDDTVQMLIKSGVKDIKHYQTIFRPLDQITGVEHFLNGYGKGGFVVTEATV